MVRRCLSIIRPRPECRLSRLRAIDNLAMIENSGPRIAYGPHPDHQEVVVALREIADWVICDYEIPG